MLFVRPSPDRRGLQLPFGWWASLVVVGCLSPVATATETSPRAETGQAKRQAQAAPDAPSAASTGGEAAALPKTAEDTAGQSDAQDRESAATGTTDSSAPAPATPPTSPALAFLEGLPDATPIAPTLSQVFLDQIQEAGYATKVAKGAVGEEGEPPCSAIDCIIATTKSEGGEFAVVGAITRNGAFDILNVVIVNRQSGDVVGRIREEGRGETAYVQKAGEYATRLFASADLGKSKAPLIYFGIFQDGTPLGVDGRKPIGQRFPVLSTAGGVVAGVGVLLIGLGALFGVTANANQASALSAATQVEASLFLDQRDINGFFANGLFLVGTAVTLAGAGALGLGLAWGE